MVNVAITNKVTYSKYNCYSSVQGAQEIKKCMGCEQLLATSK